MGWEAVAGGVLGAAGSIFQGIQARNSAKSQENFQKRMSNSAYQRQMRDLDRAGLNPMLAAKIGGASTPQGAGYQFPNVGQAATQGAHNAASAKQVSAQTTLTTNEATKSGQEAALYEKAPEILAAEKLKGVNPLILPFLKAYWEKFIKNDAKSSLADALSGALDTTPPGETDKIKPLDIEIKGDKNSGWNPKKKLTKKQIREKIERETKGMNHSEKLYYFKNHPNWRY